MPSKFDRAHLYLKSWSVDHNFLMPNFKTFNMGGMCPHTDPEGTIALEQFAASWTIGKVVEGTGKVWLMGTLWYRFDIFDCF